MIARNAESVAHVSMGRVFQHPTNRILAALSADDSQRLAPHLRDVPLPFKLPLHKVDEPVAEVFFPDSGVCSLMAMMRSGAAAEVGTIGNEGCTGLPLYFGDTSGPSQVLVQVPGAGRALPAAVFQREMAQRGALHRAVGHYAHALMMQVMQSAACNALHSTRQRACKWLLQTHDRVFTDEFMLTHEFLGMMLGITRPHLTVVMHEIQTDGLVLFKRGHVTVLDRQGLEAGACECYAMVADYFDRFLARLTRGPAS